MTYSIASRVPIGQTERDLAVCFKQWGVVDWHIDYNVQRARLNNITLNRTERSVTLRWIPKGRTDEIVLPMDSQSSVALNLRVLYLAVDSMRLNEKRGIDVGLMRTAYMQLGSPSADDLWTAVGAREGMTYEQALSCYRAKARDLHTDLNPDAPDGGMAALNVAWDELRAQQGWA